MTGTLDETEKNPTDLPLFPMKRAAKCPFDPPPELKAKQAEGPFTRVRLANGVTPWLVTGYAAQRAALADPRFSADVTRPGFPNERVMTNEGGGSTPLSFVLMDDPEHARQRRMVTAPFTIRRVEVMRPAVQKIADDLIDAMLAGPKPADLVEAIALPLPSLVICELLGVPYADHDMFQHNSKTIINRTSTPVQVRSAAGALVGYLAELMEVKLESPGDDLLSGLTERVRAGELTPVDAAQMGLLLLLGGHETTANMIALGTLVLLEHPDQLALLAETDDPKVVAGAVEELLRYLNITHNGRRRLALEDVEIDGQLIRAGEGIIAANDIGNRDPEIFADPDRLDLTRDARRHVAFGFGVHQCLGQSLARVELQVVYSTLYRRIPTLQLAAPIDDIPFKHEGAIYGVHELPVTW